MSAGSVVLARSVVLTVPFNNVVVVLASSAARIIVLASLVSVLFNIGLVVLTGAVALATVYFSGAVSFFPGFVVLVVVLATIVSFLATTFCVRWQSELY